MSLITALICVLGALAIGEIVSIKSKAIIPSVFITAIIFLIGYWTIFPANILEIAGFVNPIIITSMLFLVTHLGTMLSLKELTRQWRSFTIALFGIVGICFGTLALGKMFFEWEMLVIATPPLTGGVVASIIMSEAATAKGLPELAVLAVVMYVMQGFVGYPLTAIVLRLEGKSLLEKFRSGELANIEKIEENEENIKRLIPSLPKEYQTTYIVLLKLALLVAGAIIFTESINEVVSRYVICLFVGVIGAESGFIERKPLNVSGSFGFYMTGLMAFIFGGLAKATPEMLQKLLVPFVGIIGFGVIGMMVFSFIIGKILKESVPMSCAISLNALYGFPANYALTTEAAKSLGETEEEKQFLIDSMLPKMLVGGFTSVTIVSVVIAGIFVKLL
ncbi:hypothetical protein [uncultured Cetobacterium sp.]|uniref:hypothetical protein n=1 Tax=uncultured Cetobacterium sp. TaxID=527638 RepID=UPI0025D78A42|nr:hypothetical protein [uncultured Cetobacterium sp.]